MSDTVAAAFIVISERKFVINYYIIFKPRRV